MRRTQAFDRANAIVIRALASQDDDGVCRLTARDADRLQKYLGVLLDPRRAPYELTTTSAARKAGGSA